jgi:hypothetical protein
MKRVNARVAVDAKPAEPVRMTRHHEAPRIRWPRNATERAIAIAIFGWHCAGMKQLIRAR